MSGSAEKERNSGRSGGRGGVERRFGSSELIDMPQSPIVFCDFDGTITDVDVTDQVLTQLAHPSWREIEQLWVRGAIGSRECLERQMALVDASREELNALVDSISTDADFPHFVRFLSSLDIPFCVVSDGFDYIIRRVLRRSGLKGALRNGTRLYSSGLKLKGRRVVTSFPFSGPPCDHDCATCKAAVIRRLRGGHAPVIFIGDGLSDRFAAEESNVVFAKRGLLAHCREKGVPYHAFENFGDVENEIRRLAGRDGLKEGGEAIRQEARRNAKAGATF